MKHLNRTKHKSSTHSVGFVLLFLLWLLLALSLSCPVINLIRTGMCARSFFYHRFLLILSYTRALHWCFSWETLHYMYHTVLSVSALPHLFWGFFWKMVSSERQLCWTSSTFSGARNTGTRKELSEKRQGDSRVKMLQLNHLLIWRSKPYATWGDILQVDICMPHGGNGNRHYQLKINILTYIKKNNNPETISFCLQSSETFLLGHHPSSGWTHYCSETCGGSIVSQGLNYPLASHLFSICPLTR